MPLCSRTLIFGVVFAGLLWPTFLMGCSLPFLSKAVVTRIAGAAKLIGWLYGLSVLIGRFHLQPRFVSALVAPDATHLRVGVARNHLDETRRLLAPPASASSMPDDRA